VKNKRNLLLAWMFLSFLPNNSKFSMHLKKKRNMEYQFRQGSSEALSSDEVWRNNKTIRGRKVFERAMEYKAYRNDETPCNNNVPRKSNEVGKTMVKHISNKTKGASMKYGGGMKQRVERYLGEQRNNKV